MYQAKLKPESGRSKHWIKVKNRKHHAFESGARSSPLLKGSRRDRHVSRITGESESATVPELTASAGIKLN